MGPDELTPGKKPVATTGFATDRRRPGRPEYVSEALIPLLRGQSDPRVAAEAALDGKTFGNPDQTRAMTGLAVSLAMSGVLWAGIAATVHFLP